MGTDTDDQVRNAPASRIISPLPRDKLIAGGGAGGNATSMPRAVAEPNDESISDPSATPPDIQGISSTISASVIPLITTRLSHVSPKGSDSNEAVPSSQGFETHPPP